MTESLDEVDVTLNTTEHNLIERIGKYKQYK